MQGLGSFSEAGVTDAGMGSTGRPRVGSLGCTTMSCDTFLSFRLAGWMVGWPETGTVLAGKVESYCTA